MNKADMTVINTSFTILYILDRILILNFFWLAHASRIAADSYSTSAKKLSRVVIQVLVRCKERE